VVQRVEASLVAASVVRARLGWDVVKWAVAKWAAAEWVVLAPVPPEPGPAAEQAGLASRAMIDSRHPLAVSLVVFSVCRPIKDCTISVPIPGRHPVNCQPAEISMHDMAPWKVLVAVRQAELR